MASNRKEKGFFQAAQLMKPNSKSVHPSSAL